MANYDQAQTFRMGQLSGTENTQVLMFSGSDIPEAPWHGMLIYRTDTQTLQVYRSSLQGGDDAFENVTGGVAGQLTFVGDTVPTASNEGDLWYDTSTDRTLYVAMAADADEIAEGEWEIVTGPLSIAELIANGLLANAINVSDLTAVTITGATIQTRDEPERGIKLGSLDGIEGFFIYDEDGTPFFTAVPAEGLAIIAGEAKLRSLTVSSDDEDDPAGGSLGGDFEIPVGGVVTLNSRTTRPKGAPLVTYGLPQVALEMPASAGFAWDQCSGLASDGTNFYSSYPVYSEEGHHAVHIAKWDMATGSLVVVGEILGPLEHTDFFIVCGTTCDESGYVYTLVNNATDFTLYRMATASMNVVDPWQDNTIAEVSVGFGFSSGQSHAVGYSKSLDRILIGWIRNDGANVSAPIVGLFEWNVSGAIGFDTTYNGLDNYPMDFGGAEPPLINLAGVCLDTYDFDDERIIMSSTGQSGTYPDTFYQVLDTSTGVWSTTETWGDGFNLRMGFCHTGTQFASLNDGIVRLFSNMWATTTADKTKHVAATFADATYETNRSPRSKTVQPNRTYMTVTASTIPFSSEADRINIYGGQGSTAPADAALYLQEAGIVGQNSFVLDEWLVSGANPPASNEFPDMGDPGVLAAGANGWSIDGASNGAIGNGTFAASVQALIDASKLLTSNIQTGTTYTLAASDAGLCVQGNHATGITITIPAVASVPIPVGSRIKIFARGAGPVTISAATVTLNAKSSGSAITSYVMSTRYTMIELWHRATDTWVGTGDIT